MVTINDDQKLVFFLKRNKIGIIPTDTIYGIASILSSKEGIERIFQIKKRPFKKKMQILVASLKQLSELIDVNEQIINYLNNCSKPTTIIYKTKSTNAFLKNHCFFDHQTVAIRFVRWEWLQNIILQTGPLVATSCNLSGKQPINNLEKLTTFDQRIDFIFAKKTCQKNPSPIFDWEQQVFKRI